MGQGRRAHCKRAPRRGHAMLVRVITAPREKETRATMRLTDILDMQRSAWEAATAPATQQGRTMRRHRSISARSTRGLSTKSARSAKHWKHMSATPVPVASGRSSTRHTRRITETYMTPPPLPTMPQRPPRKRSKSAVRVMRRPRVSRGLYRLAFPWTMRDRKLSGSAASSPGGGASEKRADRAESGCAGLFMATASTNSSKGTSSGSTRRSR
mmetsp:Transcript_19799/g.66579  ORF Transcript_19799/g.66579 Transcript_19799/m.66579 type:complete len:213 (+) Transcript_19799:243-881(+)